MEPQSPGLDAAIAAIWTKHRDLMFTRMDVIDAALTAAEAGTLDADRRAAAHRDAHKLAGALGTFGLHDGTAHARTIEHALEGETAIDAESLRKNARELRAALASRD